MEPGPAALGCVQPSRSLQKLCKCRGGGRAQERTGPARSLHGAPAAPGAPAARRCPAVPGAGPGGGTPGRAGRRGVPASPSAVLSALGNAEPMFVVFFFSSPLGVYVSKKWLTVNIRFHFWESQILQFALSPCSRGYKCDHLPLWLEEFFFCGCKGFSFSTGSAF